MTTEADNPHHVSVLLVDDMEDNLTALEAVLSTLDVSPVRARSGEQAVEALRHRTFAVILLDAQMPGMDGFVTATHIKRLDRAKDVPIVLLIDARHANEAGYAFRGYATGIADYLSKPFDPWVLRAKVTVFLELHRARQQLRRLLVEEHERWGTFAQRLTDVERQLADSGVEQVTELGRRVRRLEETARDLCHGWTAPR